ncbi:lasso peptide biosynthesis B2 protein [Isoptericola sp. NEAU-Y5]|uniref:Lasso peptide biosynthesis B2 protein n=1 Tax=Isoptericola luteus TaxID=2879484 RepID=A0ABS7ZCU8_9MICO|nr:lasso peptide biosynthesis B2 protein [Isoptericola sp. NEAU-Y5]MCA5892871.1 lasso peptide biosynthesis B2 protein [Isoptericola sp. NEAU-Y5]
MTARDVLRTLRVTELPELLRSTFVAARMELWLRRAPLDAVAGRMGARLCLRAAPETGTAALALTAAERARLGTARRVTRHWPFGDTCLRRSLMTAYHLRDREPELYVGVAKKDGEVTAHAWLVVDGVNLDPTGSAQFQTLEKAGSRAR